jgi:hypothetical protein
MHRSLLGAASLSTEALRKLKGDGTVQAWGQKTLRARGLDFEHMIKARAHKGGVRIGKTPKKLASICCP